MTGCCLCPTQLAYWAVGLLVMYRLHVYRTIRQYQGLIIFAFLMYRLIQLPADEKSLLEVVVGALHKLEKEGLPQSVLRLCLDVVLISVVLQVLALVNSLTSLNFRGLKKVVFDAAFGLVKDVSVVKSTLLKEQEKMEQSFDKELKLKSRALGNINRELPSKGLDKKDILELMSSTVRKEDTVWEKGHLSGSVYHGQRGHKEFLDECFAFYSLSNPLHPDIWPSVMKYEAEIISMTASLVNGGKDSVCGCTTSGGTESIILAIKAHRDYYQQNFNITAPELICAVTAHAAVDKACDLMNIKLIKVDVDLQTYRINLSAVRRAIGPNTIMLYGSAPQYPHGSIDNIKEMSKIAMKYRIGLHVDCCLGGFVLPFAKKAGYKIPGKYS